MTTARFNLFLSIMMIGSFSLPERAVAPPSGRVIATGNLTTPRFDHTATLLPNGKVLIAAGMERNGVPYKTAELFDPQSNRFGSIGETKLNHGWGSVAVLLETGKVLLAGGSNTRSVPLDGAELYDPATNTFSLTASMRSRRDGALAVRLRNGNVLIIGGEEGATLDATTAEVYSPEIGQFAPTGALHAKGYTTALSLNSGKVLVIGPSNTELYDPSTGLFSVTGPMKTPRTKFAAALLPDGKVLVAGGQVDGAWGETVSVTEIYDPATGSFSAGPAMTYKRFKLKQSVVTLKSGRVLIGGGADQPEVYDPGSKSFLVTSGTRLDGFLFSTATLLSDGRVLLVGGYQRPGGDGVDHAWLYQPE
jgi:hypothetical protein